MKDEQRMFRMKYTVTVIVAVLILSVAFVLKYTTRSTTPTEDSYSTVILLPAQEWRPMWDENEGPFASEDFMLIKQSEDHRLITKPVADVTASRLIERDCGTLSVTISSNGAITLNTDDVGTVRDTSGLRAKLTDVFNVRVTQKAYIPGMEQRTDLTDIKRIPRTVLLRPSRSVAIADVLAVLELLRELSAEPIGLQIDLLPS